MQVDGWLAQLAESLGCRSWWASDHVVLPSPRVDPSPSEPDTVVVDPLTHLACVAAVTSTLELGVGAGYLEPEMTAVGASFDGTVDEVLRRNAEFTG